MANKGAYISPAIKDPAIRDTLQSFADDIEAAGVTIANADPAASTRARSGRLWYNATSSNLFIFSDSAGGWVPAANTGEEKTYHAVRIYWPNSTSPYPGGTGAAPQVTLTWANLTQASAGARWKGGLNLPTVNSTPWQEDPPATISNSQNTVWWSDVIFQRTGSEATTTSTGTIPQKHTNFDGLVTFTNFSGQASGAGLITGSQVNSNVTSINGGIITTRSIEADSIKVGVLTADEIVANGITRVQSGSPIVGSGISSFEFFDFFSLGSKAYDATAMAIVTIYGSATSSTSVTITGVFTGGNNQNLNPTSTLGHGITATGAVALGTHVLADSATSITNSNARIRVNFSVSNLGNQANGNAPQAKCTFIYMAYYR